SRRPFPFYCVARTFLWRGHSWGREFPVRGLCLGFSLAGHAGRNARATSFLYPQPLVLFITFNQPSPDRILSDVFDLFFQYFVRSNDVIERFLLPHRSRTPNNPIYIPCRRSLDSLQNVSQPVHISSFIAERSHKQMHMFWHDDGRMQLEPAPISI